MNNSHDDDSTDRAEKEHGGDKPERRPLYRRPLAMTILTILIVGGGVAATVWWLHARHYESTDDAFINGHVIPISPQVGARVQKVLIDDNQHVMAGDVLVILDDHDYQAALDQAKGNYAAAQGKLEEANAEVKVRAAGIEEAKAELAVATANSLNAKEDLDRFLALDVRARSKQQLDNATANQRSTAAQVQDAQAKVDAAQAQADDALKAVDTANGNLQTAQGALRQAQINLGYCTITAESDGVITRKDVEPGMYVQVDQPLFQIVTYDVWVVANLKETQLADVWPGQPVEISIDAYPGRELTGKVQSLQNGSGSRFSLLPPENATGNYVKVIQRVPVKIVLDPGQNDDMAHLLSPGMSVEPDIRVR